MGDPSTGEFVLKTYSADDPATPDEAAAKSPTLQTLRNSGGSQMEEGRIRWYMVRLKGFEAVDAAYELLLLICLNRAERERFKLTQKPLSPWFVSMLIDSGFFAVEEKEEFPWKINLVVDARRVVRAAVSKVGEEYKLVNPIQKPKPAEANAPKPTN